MSESSEAPSAPATLEEVATEVAALRDLFQRRLLDDRAKTRLYDELYAQVAFARDDLTRAHLRPLFGELLLIIDRLLPHAADDEVIASVVTELEEVIGRRGVRRMSQTGSFDPAVHDAARTEPSRDIPRGGVLTVLRDGYTLNGSVLRPAAVVVSTGPSTPAPGQVAVTDRAVEGSDG